MPMFEIVLDDEMFSVSVDRDGEIEKILMHSFSFDEWIDATKQLGKYDSLKDLVNFKFDEWNQHRGKTEDYYEET